MVIAFDSEVGSAQSLKKKENCISYATARVIIVQLCVYLLKQ